MIFTDTERCILESANKCYKWIARDEDGDMYFYERMPYRDEDAGIFNTDGGNVCFAWDKCFSDTLFSSVTWENSPIQFRDDKPLTPKEREYLKLVKPLTPKEREYLKLVFRPFASHIASVRKLSTNNSEYIWVYIWNGRNGTSMTFPVFEKGTMYKGMKLKKPYTPEELGIL